MNLFLDDAVREIHKNTRGYPRRIGMLCHKALTQLILKNRHVVDKWLIQAFFRALKTVLAPGEPLIEDFLASR